MAGQPVSIITGTGDDLTLDRAKLETRAQNILDFTPSISMESLTGLRWDVSFFGKSIAKLVYHWLANKSQGIAGKSKVPYDTFLRLCISNMTFDPVARPRDAYYNGLADKLLV